MSRQFVWTFPGGKLEQSVTSVVLVNNTQKIVDTSVPAGKRWRLLSVKMVNADNVDRTCRIFLYKEAAKTNKLRPLEFVSVATTEEMVWPNKGTSSTFDDKTGQYAPVILTAANTISCIWEAGGASAGATDADGLVIEYLELDE